MLSAEDNEVLTRTGPTADAYAVRSASAIADRSVPFTDGTLRDAALRPR